MPYNPGIQYRGDQHLFNGITGAFGAIGEGIVRGGMRADQIAEKKKEEEKEKAKQLKMDEEEADKAIAFSQAAYDLGIPGFKSGAELAYLPLKGKAAEVTGKIQALQLQERIKGLEIGEQLKNLQMKQAQAGIDRDTQAMAFDKVKMDEMDRQKKSSHQFQREAADLIGTREQARQIPEWLRHPDLPTQVSPQDLMALSARTGTPVSPGMIDLLQLQQEQNPIAVPLQGAPGHSVYNRQLIYPKKLPETEPFDDSVLVKETYDAEGNVTREETYRKKAGQQPAPKAPVPGAIKMQPGDKKGRDKNGNWWVVRNGKTIGRLAE